jgi:site-specific DNA-methyltransferase (adenine-specific)
VELPEQLIRLYTFTGDLVLDPFMGSGSALVAAARLGRRYVGYDLDPEYVAIARQRVVDEVATPEPSASVEVRATREGKAAPRLAEELLRDAGFTITEANHRVRGTGVTVDFVAQDGEGEPWYFDVAGAFTSRRGGMQRTDMVWKSLGRAAALQEARGATPLVFLTTHLPRRPGEGDTALRAAGPATFFDAVELLSEDALDRLTKYAGGGCRVVPLPGFWTARDLVRLTR